jgi:hypothetical protein
MDPDYNPGSSGSLQTYFRSGNPADSGDSAWIRMCQFGFGGDCKWAAFLACNCLTDPNYGTMKLHGAIPLKTTHLLCGSSTDNVMANDVAGYWAKNMIKGKQKIADAWFNAGTKAMHGQTSIGETITYRVTGYPECMNDTIANNVAPSPPSPTPGNLTKRDVTVFTP